MLRATSEMAVAIMVASTAEKPSSWASCRPAWRVATTSESWLIAKRRLPIAGPLPGQAQAEQGVIQVEGGDDVVEVDTQLGHREGHVGTDAGDHGARTAQVRRVRDGPEQPAEVEAEGD